MPSSRMRSSSLPGSSLRESPMPDRAAGLHRARRLSLLSVVAGVIAAIAGAVIGVSTGSLAVIGFAIDAAIDATASVALVWRFAIEQREPERALRVEHLAERAVGWVLLVAAVSLGIGAARALLAHDVASASIGQVVLLLGSLLVLPPLAVAKRRVATALGSKALANDALLTGAAAVLAGVALIAVALGSIGLWWADAIGSVLIAAALGREGWASVRLSREPG
ncbi:MAG TPA: cation transporter [Candidatus Limnocylindrales bacterium]|nr:cation transporter [Candidatus Limnocylindrales bacterium]